MLFRSREFFQTLAEIQFESGYPYIMYEDTVNKANPIKGRINMSNLCSEILQVNTPTTYNEDLSYADIGKDISCNLGSLNIALTMDSPDLASSKVMSGTTTPSERVLMRIFSSAFSRLVSRNFMMSGWWAFKYTAPAP